jgi:hypothetical protein
MSEPAGYLPAGARSTATLLAPRAPTIRRRRLSPGAAIRAVLALTGAYGDDLPDSPTELILVRERSTPI